MAARRQTTKAANKRGNGEGESITINFDIHDRTERRAMQMSKMLAAKHGRRKQFIVAVLASLYDVFEATGELPEAHSVAALLSGAAPAVGSAALSATSSKIRTQKANPKAPRVTVSNGAAKTNADTIAKNFLASNSSFWD
jgi:hypothetical protein